MKRWKVLFITLLALLIAALACNAPGARSSVTPTPEGRPSVVISSPPSGTEVVLGEEVLIQSTSTDSVGVTRVDLQVDGVVVRSDTAPDPQGQTSFALLQSWTPTEPGEHTLSVIAYRADGTASDPATIMIRVAEGELEAASTSEACTVRSNTNLNIRTGPGTDYPIVGILGVGETAPVIGRDSGAFWWQISYAGGPGGVGWVSAAYTAELGDCTNVPLASYGPPPTEEATEEPTPEPTPEATEEPGAPTATPTNTPEPSPPDLVVSSIEMPSLINLAISDGTVEIKVTVTNVGDQPSGPFHTSVWPEGRGFLMFPVDLGLVATLEGGQSITLTTDYTYDTAGTYTVEAEVDPDNDVTEGDEGNNIRTVTVEVVFEPLLILTPIFPAFPIATPTP